MLVVKYSAEGKAISDSKAMEMAQKFVELYKNGDTSRNVAHVSTENFIMAMRTIVAQGVIDHKEVVFEMDGNKAETDIMGQLHLLPLDYRNEWDKLVSGYMDACLARAREIHEKKQSFGE